MRNSTIGKVDYQSNIPDMRLGRALSRILEDIIERAGLRTIQHKGGPGGGSATYIKDFMLAHGFRKFFNTQLVTARINPHIKELLMGHLHVGLESSYYRPQEEDIQAEFEKAVDLLTVDPASRLRKKVEKLEVERTYVDQLRMEIDQIKKSLKKGS